MAAIAAFGGLLFGYDTGVPNDALVGGTVSDLLGRRRNIVLLAVLFFVGAFASALTPTFTTLLLFRFVLGLAVGGASVTVPIYLTEIAPFEGGAAVWVRATS